MDIFMLVVLFLDVSILDKTYALRLLVYEAPRLRFETGN